MSVSILKGLAKQSDPRFFKRKTDVKNLEDLTATVENRGSSIPDVSIQDLEGRPFIITQSDRSAARGDLTDINGVPLSEPVNLRGGADYMFDDNNAVWASAPSVVKSLDQRAKKLKANTGQDPLLIPQSMAPTGIDFATMPLEAMFKYAAANMGKNDRLKLNRKIREMHPTFKGVEDPEAIKDVSDFGQGDLRKEIQNMLDVSFRNSGGLSLPEARLVTSDVSQLATPDTRIKNIGVIDTSTNPSLSTHPTYAADLGGYGLGSLKENVNAFDLIPQQSLLRYGKTISDPTAAQKRALSMNHSLQEGVITDDIIKAILAGTAASGAKASENQTAVDDVQAGASLASFEAQQNSLLNRAKRFLNSPMPNNDPRYDIARAMGEDVVEPNRAPKAMELANFLRQYSPDVPVLGQFLGTGVADYLEGLGYNKTVGEALGLSAFAALDVADLAGAGVLVKQAGKKAATSSKRYHGTKDPIDQIDSTKLQFNDSGLLGTGFYTTSDPYVAGVYAKKAKSRVKQDDGTFAEPNIIPLDIAEGKYKIYNQLDKQELGMAVRNNPSFAKNLTQQNISEGYIGARMLDGKGKVVEQVNYFPSRDVENAITPFKL